MRKPKIVIVGAGFGGTYTLNNICKSLSDKDVSITIINKEDHFLFAPLIHEVATGGLSKDLTINLITNLTNGKKVRFIKDEVENIDLIKQRVYTKELDFNYDYLVIATGASTNYFNIQGAKEHSTGLKTIKDAIKIKKQIITSKGDIAVVGGGATGVELVAELAEYVYSDLKLTDRKIYLIHDEKELITQYHKKLRKQAFYYLKKLGVRIKLNSKVQKVTKNNIYLEKGTFFGIDSVFWTAGVKPNIPKFKPKVRLNDLKRIDVDEYHRIRGYENAYAIGDVAGVCTMLAHAAVEQAKVTAYNIEASIKNEGLKKFKYREMGRLISLGHKNALAEIFGIKMSGRFMWFIWRTVYLAKTITWKKKIQIAISWTIRLFSNRDTKIDVY